MTGQMDRVTAMAVADRRSHKTVAVAVAIAAVVVDRCSLIFKNQPFDRAGFSSDDHEKGSALSYNGSKTFYFTELTSKIRTSGGEAPYVIHIVSSRLL